MNIAFIIIRVIVLFLFSQLEIAIKCCFLFGEVMLDQLQAQVLCLGHGEVHDGDGEGEDGGEEIEGAVEGQVGLQHRKELEADDEEDARKTPR